MFAGGFHDTMPQPNTVILSVLTAPEGREREREREMRYSTTGKAKSSIPGAVTGGGVGSVGHSTGGHSVGVSHVGHVGHGTVGHSGGVGVGQTGMGGHSVGGGVVGGGGGSAARDGWDVSSYLACKFDSE